MEAFPIILILAFTFIACDIVWRWVNRKRIPHNRTGNCFDVGKCNECGFDVCCTCHEHGQARGECGACAPCDLCEMLTMNERRRW